LKSAFDDLMQYFILWPLAIGGLILALKWWFVDSANPGQKVKRYKIVNGYRMRDYKAEKRLARATRSQRGSRTPRARTAAARECDEATLRPEGQGTLPTLDEARRNVGLLPGVIPASRDESFKCPAKGRSGGATVAATTANGDNEASATVGVDVRASFKDAGSPLATVVDSDNGFQVCASGKGSKVLELSLPSGRFRMSWTAGKEGVFRISREAEDSSFRLVTILLRESDSGEKVVRLVEGGRQVFSIEAAGMSWTLKFAPL